MSEVISIHGAINQTIARHSRESGNPGKHWIPGQARNDNFRKTYVVVYRTVKIFVSLLVALLLLDCLSLTAFSGNGLSPKEKQGKAIFLTTTSPTGNEIKAFVGIASLEAPGSAMACANCHGYDGRGRPEGGITPSDITWKELTKSYGVKHAGGREHPAYSEETLARAITKGIDPGGNKLNPAMPVFSMASEDLTALIAYLKHLGSELDPGISENDIRIGTMFPSEGPLAALGESIGKILQAYFAEINGQGGIYNRQLDLVVGRGKTRVTREQVSAFLQEQDLFALVSTFLPELDGEIPGLVEAETIPLIGPFTLFPNTELALNRYLFYIFSGLREQARALVEFAALHLNLKDPQLVILYPARNDLGEIIAAAEEEGKEKGWNRVFRREYPLNQFDAAEWIREFRKSSVDLVLFLGVESEGRALVEEARTTNWVPTLLLPGVLMGKSIDDIPSIFKDRVLIAYPTLPEDRGEQGMREFSALLQKHHLPVSNLGAQVSAYAAAKILLEGLRRSGREVSREKFITTLEKMFEFDTGLTPLITYGPNRHIGAMGAYIVTVNPDQQGKKEFIASKKWVSLE